MSAVRLATYNAGTPLEESFEAHDAVVIAHNGADKEGWEDATTFPMSATLGDVLRWAASPFGVDSGRLTLNKVVMYPIVTKRKKEG